jgi:hypothetical protein
MTVETHYTVVTSVATFRSDDLVKFCSVCLVKVKYAK